MTTIEKIRAEIERLGIAYKRESEFRTVRSETAKEVLSKIGAFLDTLPDEHQPNLDLIKKSWYTEGYHDALFRLEPIWIIRDLKYVENPKCGQPLPEQPVEGLDAEIENYFGNIPDDTDKIDIARHFYDLGLNGKK